MVSLTLYGSAVASSEMATACQMAITTGGSETSRTTTYAQTGTYVEIYSQGGTNSTSLTSIGSPSGHGWVYKPGGGTFVTGNWSASTTLAGTYTAINTIIRFYKYSSGAYTLIGSITSSPSVHTKTTVAYAATSMPSVTFGSDDLLYVDLWWYDNNFNAQNDNPIVYESSSASAGVAGDIAVTTSSFTPAAVTPLTVYLAQAASTSVGTARQLYVTGGTPSAGSAVSTIGVGGSGYGQLCASGSAGPWAGMLSLPADDGKGFLLEAARLDLTDQQFPVGNWTPHVRLTSMLDGTTLGGTITGSISVRYAVRHTDGSFTTIATSTLEGQTIPGSVTSLTLPTVTGAKAALSAPGDQLYLSLWLYVTGLSGGATRVRLGGQSTDSTTYTGHTDGAHATPGYQPWGGGRRTVAMTAAVTGAPARVVSTMTPLRATATRTLEATAAFSMLPTAQIHPALSAVVTEEVTRSHLWLYSGTTCRDMSVAAVFQVAADGGLVARYSDATHYYLFRFCDTEGGVVVDGAGGHTCALEVANGGAPTQLALGTLTFNRTVPHLAMFSVERDILTATFDGVPVLQVTNSALLSTRGQGGYRYMGAPTMLYSLRIEGEGSDVRDTPARVQTRMTLSSQTPLSSPAVRSLRVQIRERGLATGALVPTTNYQKQKTPAAILDDVAALSSAVWRVMDGHLTLLPRGSQPLLPWVLSSATLLGVTPPKVVRSSPRYRNRHWILGARATRPMEESRTGDGERRAWTMTYPLDAEPLITLDGAKMRVGIKDVESGKDFYWARGEKEITQDEAGMKLTAITTLTVDYTAQITKDVMAEDTQAQAARAALDQTSGIVEAYEQADGLDEATAETKAQAIIDEWARTSRTFTAETDRAGAHAGMLACVFVPEYGISDGSFYITEVKTIPHQRSDGTLFHTYGLTLVEGPNQGSWSRYFQALSASTSSA